MAIKRSFYSANHAICLFEHDGERPSTGLIGVGANLSRAEVKARDFWSANRRRVSIGVKGEQASGGNLEMDLVFTVDQARQIHAQLGTMLAGMDAAWNAETAESD